MKQQNLIKILSYYVVNILHRICCMYVYQDTIKVTHLSVLIYRSCQCTEPFFLQALLLSLLFVRRLYTRKSHLLLCISRHASLFVYADISKMLNGKMRACSSENKEGIACEISLHFSVWGSGQWGACSGHKKLDYSPAWVGVICYLWEPSLQGIGVKQKPPLNSQEVNSVSSILHSP